MQSQTQFFLFTALIVAVIVYGSLYPFDFRIPVGGDGAVVALLRSWKIAPSGRGDLVANVLLYIPLGWFGIMSLPPRMSVAFRIILMGTCGAMLSLTMELTQYYAASRMTAASDVYANFLGTMVGCLGGIYLSGRWRVPLIAEISTEPIPAGLLASWAGYRLYPYVPTIDLHKYWNALKPVIVDPVFSLTDLYRHTTIWLTTISLILALVGHRRSVLLAPLFCGGILVARILIIDTALSISEVMGAAVALCIWPIMLAMSCRRRAALLFLFMYVAVVVERLQPFQFQSVARNFGWVPFRSLMTGSIAVNVMAFCEKSFMYGALLFLFTEAGGRLRLAVLIVGAMVFVSSWVEIYLPGRSAEVTDFIMVLLLAGSFVLLRSRQTTA